MSNEEHCGEKKVYYCRDSGLLEPDIKTLFMSGYPSDILENHGFDDQAIEFIMKPLNPIGLLRKIRSILG